MRLGLNGSLLLSAKLSLLGEPFFLPQTVRVLISVDSDPCNRLLASGNNIFQLLPVEKEGKVNRPNLTSVDEINLSVCASVSSDRAGFGSGLQGAVVVSGIFINFADVGVPFIPVDFLHSETRGHTVG